jgi:hypothetical protein
MNLRRLALICATCAVVTLTLRARFHVGELDVHFFAGPSSLTPIEHHRSSEFTYLTIPEWYLVWSPEEYADFVADHHPSDFPFLGHLQQFWQGYGAVYDATRKYPFNTDYHMMIMVIGVSTTIEYGLKWTYEKMVGRVSEAMNHHGMTAEDRVAAQTARAYVDFILVEPWYKFDFMKPLQEVWSTDLWGPDPIRKWERKYLLTSEYLVKGAYGWLIKKGSESVYDEEKPVTAVVLDRLPPGLGKKLPEVKVLKEYGDGSVLALVPRYQAFTTHARILSLAGVNFREIAGNVDGILVGAVVPLDYDDFGLEIFLAEPILTRSGWRRIVVSVPVPRLAEFLRRRDRDPLRLEHIYDY